MIVGIVIVLMVGGLHEVMKGWLDCDKSIRRQLPSASDEPPVLRREVIIKNPVKNK